MFVTLNSSVTNIWQTHTFYMHYNQAIIIKTEICKLYCANFHIKLFKWLKCINFNIIKINELLGDVCDWKVLKRVCDICEGWGSHLSFPLVPVCQLSGDNMHFINNWRKRSWCWVIEGQFSIGCNTRFVDLVGLKILHLEDFVRLNHNLAKFRRISTFEKHFNTYLLCCLRMCYYYIYHKTSSIDLHDTPSTV